MKNKKIIRLTSISALVFWCVFAYFCGYSQIVHPETRPVSVLVNQVGYNTNREKITVVQLRDTLNMTGPSKEFRLIDISGKTVFTGKLVYQGRVHDGTPGDWRAQYWTGDFSQFNTPGEYLVQAQVGTQKYFSFLFRIDNNILFKETIEPAVSFFHNQRCGFSISRLHLACHLDDARNPYSNNSHKNATGGWHNAGDLNKYATISCRSVYALFVLARNASMLGLPDSIRTAIIDEGLWGAEFLIKMWIPGKGMIYQEVWNGYQYFGRPDLETDNVIGTKDDRPLRGISPSAMTACALAAAARETGREDYRIAAEEIWRTAVDSLHFDREEIWANTCGAFPVLENDSLGRLIRRTADLLLADLELKTLTGDNRYTVDAQLRAESLLTYQNADGSWPADVYTRTVYQGLAPAALALYARTYPNTSFSEKIINALYLWVNRLTILTDNPFNLIPWDKGVYFSPHLKYWYVGQNSQYLSNAWALYLAAPLIGQSKATLLADRQIDWILGLNPYSLCMMEGKGGFNSPLYHHRWAPNEARGAVPGAIANGFCRPDSGDDRPYFDLVKISWHTSEPWEPHNAFYILAVSACAGNGTGK